MKAKQERKKPDPKTWSDFMVGKLFAGVKCFCQEDTQHLQGNLKDWLVYSYAQVA